jgi:glycosyltransferase involved in cell wall biosynthesis
MKILLVHNKYQQSGGEDVVFEQEKELLLSKGHLVIEYVRSNNEIADFGILKKIHLVKRMLWASDSYKDLKKLIRTEHPEVAHFHNTFPLVSPSAYYACKEQGIPVVQTLHNYRLLCPRADFYRGNYICEECLRQGNFLPSLRHRCYHKNLLHTAGVASIIMYHRLRHTWENKIDIFIALTEFSKAKFIQGGIPAEKICLKPNFVFSDPGRKSGTGDYVAFAGRFSPEKRTEILFSAWKELTDIPLYIAGGGPELEKIRKKIEELNISNVKLIGRLPREEIFQYLKSSRFLVFPSAWYETFGMTIIEAFAVGLPVIASRLGSMKEIVQDNVTGLHFNPGDSKDLAEKVKYAWSHPDKMLEMGKNARREYENSYMAERNYTLLMEIYQRAIERAKKG